MKVILLQNIRGFGQIGDVKNVSDGYASNFLLPKGLAKSASVGSLREVESLKKKLEMSLTAEKERATELSQKLQDVAVEFTKKASKTGKLFSSVTKENVAEALSKITGARIEKSMISLGEQGEHIKQIGEHTAEIELAPGIKITAKISIKEIRE